MRNSFSARILFMVFLGIGIIAVTVSSVVLVMSQNAFTDTYGRSQEQVFNQIENELNDFHTDLQNLCEGIDSSWAFRLYLNNDTPVDNVQNFQNIYQMEQDVNATNTTDMERLNVLVVGMNGKNYLSRTETITVSDEEIMASEAVQRALKEPENVQYTYAQGGYTATSAGSNVIIASKALYLRESQEVYGVVLVTLSMDDMLSFYDYFVSENTDWFLVDNDQRIMCSNHRSTIGTVLDEDWYLAVAGKEDGKYVIKEGGRSLTILQKELSYLGCSMYGVIDNDVALKDLYDMPFLIVLCAFIALLILTICTFFIRKTLKPLSNLVDKMSDSRKENFREYVPVEGTAEVRQLATTYNEMLDDIQNYISELMDTQQAQRKAEIKALQMQINPHYIYNTLASIKWLVYQNDTEKTTKTIDAFISLLRNTISNTDEMISVEQELVNIENYVLINHTRYGDAIQVEYHVAPDCYNYMLPKLVLQPFIENAFFHAFPSGESGIIQIWIEKEDEKLMIRIKDDGIGMEQAQAENVVKNQKEHFSGIGIHNVQDRLQLLFGSDYGIQVDSGPDEGTEITVCLPVRVDS